MQNLTPASMLEEARKKAKEDELKKAELSISLLAFLNCILEAINWFAHIKQKDDSKNYVEIIELMEIIQEKALQVEELTTSEFDEEMFEKADEFSEIMMNIRTYITSMPPTVRAECDGLIERRFERWKKDIQKMEAKEAKKKMKNKLLLR